MSAYLFSPPEQQGESHVSLMPSGILPCPEEALNDCLVNEKSYTCQVGLSEFCKQPGGKGRVLNLMYGFFFFFNFQKLKYTI